MFGRIILAFFCKYVLLVIMIKGEMVPVTHTDVFSERQISQKDKRFLKYTLLSREHFYNRLLNELSNGNAKELDESLEFIKPELRIIFQDKTNENRWQEAEDYIKKAMMKSAIKESDFHKYCEDFISVLMKGLALEEEIYKRELTENDIRDLYAKLKLHNYYL